MPIDHDQGHMILRDDSGAEIDLRGPIYLVQHEGLGVAGVRQMTSVGPEQHGATLLASYWSSRIITLRLLLRAESEQALSDLADELYDMLGDLSTVFYLDCYRPDGEVRRLEVVFYDGLSGPRQANGLYLQRQDTLQLVCHDVFPYTPGFETVTFGPIGVAAGMPVPVPVPVPIGTTFMDQTINVPYVGSWDSSPIIRFYGPMVTPRIENVTTGDVITFQAQTYINENNWWEIDLRYGYKTVRDQSGNMQMDKLSWTEADLASFRLASPPIAPGGNNSLRVVALGCDPLDSYATVMYRTFWKGV